MLVKRKEKVKPTDGLFRRKEEKWFLSVRDRYLTLYYTMGKLLF
jgi:hypothetical protein